MQLSPLPHSTAADLLRVLAGWLVLIFALQGVAAAHALGSGPLHRHAVSQHATWQGKSQTHHHDTAQRHHHASGDASGGTSVQSTPASTDGMDAAAFALTAALALLAVAGLRTGFDPRSHVLRGSGGWSLCQAWLARLRRPPKLC